MSASASNVLVELLAHHTLHGREILALRFTNTGQYAIGLGPGLIRSLFSHGAPVAAGASSDVCSLAPGHDADLTLSIPVHLDARLLEVEIGLLEMQRSGATIRLRFAPLRADAIGGDANTSVRTDSATSPDSLPACLH